MQVVKVCVVMEADQQCELEALSNWLGTHPRLRVSVTVGGSMLCGKLALRQNWQDLLLSSWDKDKISR